MKTYKQIIYRTDDGALMIVPSELMEAPAPRFVQDLTDEQKLAFLNLKTLLLTYVDTLDYSVYTTDIDTLYAQPIEGRTVEILVSDLSIDDKKTVVDVLDICSTLINIL